MSPRRPDPVPSARPAFAGFCFPADVIVVAVRWYLRFGLSYRDVEELLAERGVEVDHVTVYPGCRGSRRCWPRPPGPAGTGPAGAGSLTRRMSGSLAAGGMSTVPSISLGRSSTCMSRRGGMRGRPPVLQAGHRHHQG